MKKKSVAVIFVSNGPGELTTWVKPVLYACKEIIQKLPASHEIEYLMRLVLVPCPNATGKESVLAKSWEQFEFISSAKHFWKLLINPAKFASWPKQGLVVFLGGDQFWSILLAKRLGYKNITYAEWTARWPALNKEIAVMNKAVQDKLHKKFHKKCHIIGDLMADVQDNNILPNKIKKKRWIALLPGSKKAKLSVGIPFLLEVADLINDSNKDIHFIIPMAPTTSIQEYLFFQSDQNSIAKNYRSRIIEIHKLNDEYFDYEVETNNQTKINITLKHPSYEILTECDLAITTVGANTAELAAINLPMIVILPTQHLKVMNAWDGIVGIISRIPLIKAIQNLVIKYWYLRSKKFFAWPNIKAQSLIVPERIGEIFPTDIAQEVLYMIDNKDYLLEQKRNLSLQRGQKGASNKLAKLIFKSLEKF